MVTLVINNNWAGGFGLVQAHIEYLAFRSALQSESPTEIVRTYGTFDYTITGIGLSTAGGGAGTITGITVATVGSAILTITNMNLPMADFVTIVGLELTLTDVTALEDLLFGYDWDTTGTDNPEILNRGTVSTDGVPVELTGDDIFHLMGGDDSFYTGAGNDQVWGGDGNDTIDGGTGADNLRGDDGDDTLLGDNGNDILFGSNGNDTLDGGNGNDRLMGARGNDMLYGGNQHDKLDGGRGRDQLRGQGGSDTLLGGKGRDRLYGAKGDDVLNGGLGDDRFWGGAGADEFVFDAVAAGDDNIVLDFLLGTDTLTVSVGVTNVVDVGGDALINFASGGTALFIGVAAIDIEALLV